MKNLLPLLALVVCLIGCGANPNAAAPNLTPTANPAVATTYDMLAWMTMSPTLALDHHMAGTANSLYTTVTGNRFFWTKTAGGYPWDIQLYDSRYIYLWVTELDWQNPRTFKVFNSSTLGKFNLPFVPRFAKGGYPGSSIKISDSSYQSTQIAIRLSQKIWATSSMKSGDPTRNRLVDSFLQTCRRW